MTKNDSTVIIVNMKDISKKNTMIRGIPLDVWADLNRIAGEKMQSVNKTMVDMVVLSVKSYRNSTEKKALIKRLDEINQLEFEVKK